MSGTACIMPSICQIDNQRLLFSAVLVQVLIVLFYFTLKVVVSGANLKSNFIDSSEDRCLGTCSFYSYS